ncbi:hypothetical protein [Desulfobacula phenolica]|uniref:Uncharacterized protein n=1 Tax=Desulfobacula phenolica TaxID=90732 RepID=A0A1H2K5Y2_9BACT|nr:hypothetical protein [Desulfobacula phenolica]SDU63798.1 hypothetical protein SAMN04487931_1216 [Desulfobacula phenolica]
MSGFLIFLAGALCVLVVAFLYKNSTKWYEWLLGLGWYAWVVMGVSFVYSNYMGHHHKAAAVGMTFFGIIAIISAFVIVRVTGLIGKKTVKTGYKEAV